LLLHPIPLILTTWVWSSPNSQATFMMRWLMVSCPQPLHKVEGWPL